MERHSDEERTNNRKEESRMVKQDYKPLLFNTALGPETAPPHDWLEGRNPVLVPDPQNQNLC